MEDSEPRVEKPEAVKKAPAAKGKRKSAAVKAEAESESEDEIQPKQETAGTRASNRAQRASQRASMKEEGLDEDRKPAKKAAPKRGAKKEVAAIKEESDKDGEEAPEEEAFVAEPAAPAGKKRRGRSSVGV